MCTEVSVQSATFIIRVSVWLILPDDKSMRFFRRSRTHLPHCMTSFCIKSVRFTLSLPVSCKYFLLYGLFSYPLLFRSFDPLSLLDSSLLCYSFSSVKGRSGCIVVTGLWAWRLRNRGLIFGMTKTPLSCWQHTNMLLAPPSFQPKWYR
jgi:hypothetical protein